jgi:hypothetical protein
MVGDAHPTKAGGLRRMAPYPSTIQAGMMIQEIALSEIT